MIAMTNDEVRASIVENAWASGIKIAEDGDLFYDSPDARCLVMNFPETPLKATYVARVLSMLGGEEEARFSGALLWLRLWTIGSTALEKSGWRLMERMRMGFGELRPLGVANGHWFREDEVVDLAAFVLPSLVYGWDAYVVPSNDGCFAFISHDEYICVATRDAEAHARALELLDGMNPIEGGPMKARFCRGK